MKITHTTQDGTLLEGSSKGDGAWDAIKTAQDKYKIRGWKFFPSLRMIGVRNSRFRAPDLFNIQATAEVLRAAGFEVTTEVDGTPMDMGEQEGLRAERMDDRAEALTMKARALGAAADGQATQAQQIAEVMNGEPLKKGHHSAARHRRDHARMEGHMRASVVLEDQASLVAGRAHAAEQHMARRENPRRVMRRVEVLETDLRRIVKSLEGYTTRHLDGRGNPLYVFEHDPAAGLLREQLLVDQAHKQGQLQYWREFLDREIQEGRFTPINLADIKKGDQIGYWGGWSEVIRVNRKTVTVRATIHGRDVGQHKVPVDEILGHKPAEPAQDLDGVLS